ncbi:Lysophosphatidylcholine acyltransferase [Daldinia childiae]|uniref:Lysophosphatidylcholine acyltransferase n=1 Tax=Daldinia childiae TaxID=326645 RepID=UPI0014472BB1|nr:Lysophosphatidylcholine acyltransferase [Daldinia childiae]KAF3060030.1 Lysophosphatidylcholine acyltransferase [Daldinia childiae]
MSNSNPNKLPLQQPSLPWRMTSSVIMGLTAALSRSFLYGLNSVEVTGLERFLEVLDMRKDVEKRQRGLITVSNHVSVLDDPLIWGVLPFSYAFNPSNHRWGMGAHDICYKNKLLGSFFYAGQVLPTHRSKHSSHGGLFQPIVPQAIRLLSSSPFTTSAPAPLEESHDILDPFTSGDMTFTTTGIDQYVAPSIYSQNRHSWIHVFPEACVHQHPKMFMRYFKWGISRMILESEPMPDVLPMFIDGPQRVMPEDREWPRFLPRFPVKFRVAFGELLDTEKKFGDLRARWQELVRKEKKRLSMGELTDELKYGKEAVNLRIEVARRVREEVAKVRRSMGYPEEEPGFELAETWAQEPTEERFKSNVDDGLINKRK